MGFKIADLVQKSKYKFGLVIRQIANKYYMDLFGYLSFLSLAIRLLSSTLQTIDLLLTLNQFLESIKKLNH